MEIDIIHCCFLSVYEEYELFMGNARHTMFRENDIDQPSVPNSIYHFTCFIKKV